ncbi:PEP-CTERM sorting domain-containing protein [Komarekiella sp. 'clone 1']|uniref:PEP-CTERM sorting domain-containing protein n=1 Tax=Komarekiella delphini-convector SJRDD-AB1 TaxID=2593771 RepID=A0AA40SU27_9NOST|nr:PEP-CTERM sorting domain-containing protein [Komarekiella delphini-convector]MBD6614992.1 PEP-CTERM sorting domain-containing protein [Komarekiella delphini-convector SJRDD-AB1]
MNKLNIFPFFSQAIVKISTTLIAGLASSLLLSSPIYAATFGTNLIVNGDAEQGQGDPIGNAVGADIPTIPGWTSIGSFSVLKYGATGFSFTNPLGNVVNVTLPGTDVPGPSDAYGNPSDVRGANLFFGGADRASSSASQLVDVSDLASTIDAGQGTFNLSGWLGGYSTDEDSAALNIIFLNQATQSLGIASIASPTAAQRNNTTGLFLQSADGFVPIGTRQINVLLNANYTRGRVNDAYADNLLLVITKVPEPSISGFLLIGTSCLTAWKLRKHRQVL